ncbi:MAG: hypothetical protein RR014_03585, partial [Bilophila sp.]
AGLTRFTSGLRQVLESPKAPSASDLAARFAELRGLKDSQLQAQLSDFGKYLETLGTGDSIISGKEFQTVLKGGGYAATLGRNEAISELMKLYVREKLGTLPTTLAPSGTR